MSTAESVPLLVARLRATAEAGQVEQALTACRDRLVADAASVELWGLLGELALRAGHKAESVAAHQKEAEILLHIGDLERAVTVYRRVLQLVPQDPDTQLALGHLYRQLGQWNRAALAYELAGQAFASRGRTRESLAAIQQLVDMSEHNVGRRIRLAEQYVRAGFPEEGIRELRISAKALRQANRLEEYGQVVDRLCVLESQRIESVDPQDAAPSLDQKSSVPLHLLAESQRTPKQSVSPDQANPAADVAATRIAEAESYLHLGLVEKAIAHLTDALSQNPYLKHLRKALVRLYIGQRSYAAAVSELWELRKQSATRDEELGYLRFIVRLDPEDDAAWEQLAELTEQSAQDVPELRQEPVSVDDVDRALRSELIEHRPATDLVATRVVNLPAMPLGPVRPAERDLHTALHTTQEITPEDIEQEVLIAPLTDSSDLPHSRRSQSPRVANPTLLSQYRSALTLFSQKQFAEAIQALESVLSDRALGARATLLIARSWCELERPSEAIASLQRGMKLPTITEPMLSELLYELGACYAQIGDGREAILYYRLSMGKDGHYRDAAAKVAALESELTKQQGCVS